MTGEQLRSHRESLNLTREGFAEYLGDCSSSTVNKWERNMHTIPDWVEEKLLRNTKVSLPLEDLAEMLEIAKRDGVDFPTLLGQAIRDYLASKRLGAKKTEAPPQKTSQSEQEQQSSTKSRPPSKKPANIVDLPAQHLNRAAEEPGKYGGQSGKPQQGA